MRDIAGFGLMLRLILRRERIDLPVWVFIIAAIPAGTAGAFAALYPDAAGLEQAATAIGGNPAFVAFLGPVQAPTLGGLTSWRVGAFLGVMMGILNVLTLTRHTRAEEQAGRRELVGATAVGRHAPLMAALVVMIVTNVLIGAAVTVGLIATGLEVAGSIAFGTGTTAIGLVFTGIAAVGAQLFDTSRASNAMGIGVVAVSFLLRVVGDAGSAGGLEFLSWVSPIGLTARIAPFAAQRWWVVGALLAVASIAIAAALAISARRDVGAGVFATRSGPPEAATSLSGPVGLAVRLQRGVGVAWLAGFAVFGLLIGAATEGFTELLAENPLLRGMMELIGGERGITEAYLATMFSVFGMAVAAHAVGAVLWLQSEELAGRVDPILATAVPRHRWLGSHTAVATGTAVLDLTVIGAATGFAYGITIGDVGGQMPRMIGAALVQLAAVLVMVGFTVAVFALAPRLTWVAWSALGTAALLTLLGRSLRLSEWLIDLSPFSHLPQVPGPAVPAGPVAGLVAVAAVLLAVGFAGFQRRDIS
jgi:ABC-2 type transport system permease protein